MPASQKKIGEIIIGRHLLTQEQMQEAIKEQSKTGEYIGKILVRKGWLSEKELLSVLSEQFGLPLVDLKNKYIDWDLVKNFSASLITDYRCFPFQKSASSITVAITNPFDVWGKKEIEEQARGSAINFVLVSESDMQEAIHRYKKYIGKYISQRI